MDFVDEDMDPSEPESFDDELKQAEASASAAAAAVAAAARARGAAENGRATTDSTNAAVDVPESVQAGLGSEELGAAAAAAAVDGSGSRERESYYDPARYSPFGQRVAELTGAERWDDLRSFLQEQYAVGNDMSLLLYVLVIGALGRAGQLQQMMEYFREMRSRGLHNVLAYNIAIGACARAHQPDQAFDLYQQMQRFGILPNQYTYGHLLQACSAVNDLDHARETLVEMRARGLSPSDFVGLELLRCCNSPREIDETLTLLETFTTNFQAHSTRTLNNAVSRSLYLGEVHAALAVYRTLLASGSKPNAFTLQQLIRSCVQSSLFDEVVALYEEAKARGLEINRNTYICMLRLFRDARRTDYAIALLREVLDLGHPVMIRAWDIALVALCEQGKMAEARIVWDLLRKHMAAVPRSTIETYVRACQVSGLASQAAEASALIPN